MSGRRGERAAGELQIVAVTASAELDLAADVWARAGCARDGDQDIFAPQLIRPRIDAVLASSSRAFVLLALGGIGEAVGMAAVGPAGTPSGAALLRYFATSPDHWGQGIGGRFLRAVCDAIVGAGFDCACLQVFATNTRAVELYERCGWYEHGPAQHPRTGEPMREYRIALT